MGTKCKGKGVDNRWVGGSTPDFQRDLAHFKVSLKVREASTWNDMEKWELDL